MLVKNCNKTAGQFVEIIKLKQIQCCGHVNQHMAI
jgi:hypothetical protein